MTLSPILWIGGSFLKYSNPSLASRALKIQFGSKSSVSENFTLLSFLKYSSKLFILTFDTLLALIFEFGS